MNNKFVNGMVKSALALSLTFVSLSSLGAANTAPTDIKFGLPVDIEPGHDLVEVAGPGDFGTYAGAGANDDDGYNSIDVSSVFGASFNFYGTTYSANSDFYVQSNGYVSFGDNSGNYEFNISNGANDPSFVMYSEDWDPGETDEGTSPGGTSTGTNDVYYHLDVANKVVTVTYDDVVCNSCGSAADSMTASQLRFHDIGAGNFVVEYRYENVGSTWGLGEELGWTAADNTNYNDDYNTTNFATNSNIDHPGVFAWMFVDGQVVPSNTGTNRVLEGSTNGTAIGSLTTIDADTGDTFTYVLLDDADGRFVLNVRNGYTYVDVADGGKRLDIDDNETHDIRVEVTDSSANTFEKVLTINVIKVPAFLTSSIIDVPVDETMNITIKTRVEQGSAIPTVTAAGLPAWMTFADNGDGTISLTGFPSVELTFKVELTMTDGFGNQTTRTFSINVVPEKDNTNKDNSNPTSTTTTTVTVTTDDDGSGGSFGWMIILLAGGLMARRKIK